MTTTTTTATTEDDDDDDDDDDDGRRRTTTTEECKTLMHFNCSEEGSHCVPARPGLPKWDSVHAGVHWRLFHFGRLAVALDLRDAGEPVEDCGRGDHWRVVGTGQHVRFAASPR